MVDVIEIVHVHLRLLTINRTWFDLNTIMILKLGDCKALKKKQKPESKSGVYEYNELKKRPVNG